MTKDSDAAITISEWPRNRYDSVRVALIKYRGRSRIDARIWYRDESGDYKAGRGGLALGVSHLPQLAEALQKALKQARKLGLLPQRSRPKHAGGRHA